MEAIILSNARHLICQNHCLAKQQKPKISCFSDGEISLELENISQNSQNILIIQSLFGSSDSILELLFAIDVITRNTSKPIHLLIPYLSYSRQDRQITSNTPLSAKVIADLISSKVSTISIASLHAPQIQGFFNKPCFNIEFEEFFIQHIKSNFQLENVCIVSADIGGAKNARKVANGLAIESAIVEKQRTKANVSEALSVIGNVSGKDCIIIDDIIDTAGTLCNAGNILHEMGAVSVTAYTAHGIFSGSAYEKIANSKITRVFTTNTIPSKPSEKITVLDCANYLIEKTMHKLTLF